jgi:hypothetical protein
MKKIKDRMLIKEVAMLPSRQLDLQPTLRRCRKETARTRTQVSYSASDDRRSFAQTGPLQLVVRGPNGMVKFDLPRIEPELDELAFTFVVPDDSMINASLHRGDLVVVASAVAPLANGDIVMVQINGEEVLRRVLKVGAISYLISANDNMENSIPVVSVDLLGVVVGLLRLSAKFVPTPWHRVPYDRKRLLEKRIVPSAKKIRYSKAAKKPVRKMNRLTDGRP